MYKFARSGRSDECHQSDRALYDNSVAGIDSVNFPSPVAQNTLHTHLLLDSWHCSY